MAAPGLWPIMRTYRSPARPVSLGGQWGDRTLIMGIINATPDSFSADGVAPHDTVDVIAAVRRAASMVSAGADIIDVGGESTRPGATRVGADVQIRRVVPVIEALAREVTVPISIDTTSAAVADAALDAGASIVNDISGTRDDPEIVDVVGSRDVPFITMHNQRGLAHNDVVDDVVRGLQATLERLAAADVTDIVIDPGFGFGWTVAQDLELLRRLPELWTLQRPILVGTSRKSTIGATLDTRAVGDRVWGTAATVAQSICAGADIVRVHDVAEMADVARVTDAIVRR